MTIVGYENAEFSERCKWNLRDEWKTLIDQILSGRISLSSLAAKLLEGLPMSVNMFNRNHHRHL